ncbi:hypothetical protein OM076_11425 [Solirubrobacter ginsenosidimutans]|uniref:Uncharacterized protein n=1 Tax=Solirubrobacter ginsenosidimutans TaxID=490573 RepID=A0A9X3S1B4_9ACTN|nr:hypothetical protein [Solirubrobacter ginsenosidimutans]MDA0160877.1 hypothetical protein [Solirubrobacter ginsenosidimutans]
MTTPTKHCTITAQPPRIAAGGIVLLTATVPACEAGDYTVEWIVEGPTRPPDQAARIALLGATTVTGGKVTLGDTGGDEIRATLDTTPLEAGSWRVSAKLTKVGGDGSIDLCSENIEVTPRPFAAGDDVAVTLKRAAVPATQDQPLWVAIRNSANALRFDRYSQFIESLLCAESDEPLSGRERKRAEHKLRKVKRRTALPFPNVDRYRVLKAATEVFLMTHCGVDLRDFRNVDVEEESARLNRQVTRAGLEEEMREYLQRVAAGDGEFLDVLPYLALIRRQLGDVAIVGIDREGDEAAEICFGILAEKLEQPCFLELLHEYWNDEAGVFHTMNSIIRRFQNRRARGRDPLIGMDINPLRPLNNLLWGMVQDQQHRLTTARRAYEYDHHYGLALATRPRPPVRGADSRSRFIGAYHHLLALCAVFYTQDDNTTVIADGFPVLNALKETHLLLTEGAHNQYGDLPWTARHEALMYQWILASPEMREFLPMRTMVAYPEPWIGSVEAMNKLQGWADMSVVHFRDLSVFGEQLLLGIRFGAWSDVIDPNQAANWVRYWRPEIQGYIHAYRAVTGVDLTQRGDRSLPPYGPRHGAPAGAYR